MRSRLIALLLPETPEKGNFSARTQKILLFVLFILLFLAGIFTENIYRFLDQVFQVIFESLGWSSFFRNSQAAVSSEITMRSWPTMLAYGFFYTTLCFTTLHVYFNNQRKSRIAAGFYFILFLLCTVLIVVGKLGPHLDWAFKLSRRLIELLVSPFPIILLMAALFEKNADKNAEM